MNKYYLITAIVLVLGSSTFYFSDNIFHFDIPIPFEDNQKRIVGDIAYNPETNEMYVEVEGITEVYCNLPSSLFEKFNGSFSRYNFFVDKIQNQFGC